MNPFAYFRSPQREDEKGKEEKKAKLDLRQK